MGRTHHAISSTARSNTLANIASVPLPKMGAQLSLKHRLKILLLSTGFIYITGKFLLFNICWEAISSYFYQLKATRKLTRSKIELSQQAIYDSIRCFYFLRAIANVSVVTVWKLIA